MKQIYLFLSCLVISIFQSASLLAKINMGTINIKIGESVQVYAEESTYYTVSGSWSITGGSSFSITSRSQRSCTIRGAKVGTSTLNWSGYSNAVYGEMYWTVNVIGSSHESINKGTITMNVGEEKTLNHNLPSGANVNSNSWFLREKLGTGSYDFQENYCLKIISKNSQSCTIKGIAATSDGTYELHCLSQDEHYDCYWTLIVKASGYIYVYADPAGGYVFSPKKVAPGTKVYLTAEVNNVVVPDAKIYYTTDGKMPNQSSKLYTSAGITINGRTYLQAVAYKDGYDPVGDGWYYDIEDIIPINSISLNKTSLSLQTEQTETLKATVKPDDATDKSVSWSSSKTSVATVSSSGLVTAKGEGSATITCKANDGSGKQATCTVTVKNANPNIQFVSVKSTNTNLSNMSQSDKLMLEGVFKNTGATATVDTKIFILDQDMKTITTGDVKSSEFKSNSQTTVKHELALSGIPEGTYYAAILYYNGWDTKKWTYSSSNLVNFTVKSTETPIITITSVTSSNSNLDNLTQNDVLKLQATFQNTGKTANIKTALNLYNEVQRDLYFNESVREFPKNKSVTIEHEIPLTDIPEGKYEATVVYYKDWGDKPGWYYFSSKVLNITVKKASTPSPVTDTDISNMPNVIYLNNVEATSGSQLTLSLKMKNKASIRGFQFDLYLPDGVKAVKNNKGRITASLTKTRLDADDEHTLTVAEQGNGSIRFLCGSQYDEVFSGSDGEVATLTVSIDDAMKDGDYSIRLKNIKLTETDISKSYETLEVIRTLTISSFKPGDINGDGKVDVSDYIGVANRILGDTPSGFVEKAGDVDGSGTIDVSDYIGVANIILTGNIYGGANSRTLARTRTIPDSKDNVIYVAPLSVDKGATSANLSICMKNSAAIRGFQFDLYLPDNVTAAKNAKGRISASLTKDRLADDDEHTLTVAEQADGAIRFLCGSQYDETFLGTDGEVASLAINLPQDMAAGDYPIILKNIKLTETDISKYYETAVLECSITVTIGNSTGIESQTTGMGQTNSTVYSISGQKLSKPHHGINIINGKKVVIK